MSKAEISPKVAEHINGWKLDEAKGRATSDVFRIVNEHTRQPVENPVEKVMQHALAIVKG